MSTSRTVISKFIYDQIFTGLSNGKKRSEVCKEVNIDPSLFRSKYTSSEAFRSAVDMAEDEFLRSVREDALICVQSAVRTEWKCAIEILKMDNEFLRNKRVVSKSGKITIEIDKE